MYNLHEVQVPVEFKDVVFPTRVQGMNRVLQVTKDSEEVCHLCMDMLGDSTVLHLGLPTESRSKETILELVQVFNTLVHDWCKEQGCVSIIVNCPGEDHKTTELFKTFGFEPQNINMAMMPVKGG